MPVLSEEDSEFLATWRSVAIMAIVLGHCGGFWFFKPFSEYLRVFVQCFFFISGAVSYYSFKRAGSLSYYYSRRILQLLIPYYLLCIFCLAVYLVQHSSFPPLNLENLIRWLSVNPIMAIMPFEVAQVWFLHTLLIIVLVAPIYFILYDKKPTILALCVFASFTVAAIQSVTNIASLFIVAGHNLYQPVVHSIFFIFGFICFSSEFFRKSGVLISIAAISLSVCMAEISLFHVDPDLDLHGYSPDLYFISTSIFAISVIIVGKKVILFLPQRFHSVHSAMRFVHKNTFSIFLLHNFAIYIAEIGLGLLHKRSLSYGIIKFAFVIAFTLLMAPFYTRSTQWVMSTLESLGIVVPSAREQLGKKGLVPAN